MDLCFLLFFFAFNGSVGEMFVPKYVIEIFAVLRNSCKITS